jgi:hypothetical protein
VYSPSEYERIIKNTDISKPFEGISVNYSNCYDFHSNNNKVAKVYKYKKKLSEILKNQINRCKNVIKIQFTVKGIKIPFTLSENCEQELEIFKLNADITNLDHFFNDINLAYEKPLPISREKLLDICKILEYIPKTVNSKFYDTLYSLD